MMLARNLPEFETWGHVQPLSPSAYADPPVLEAVTADLLRVAVGAAAQQGYLIIGEPTMSAAFTRLVHRTEDEHVCDRRCIWWPATEEDATLVALRCEVPVRPDTPIYDAVLAEQHAAKLAQLADLMRRRAHVSAVVHDLQARLAAELEPYIYYAGPTNADDQVVRTLARKAGRPRDAHGRFLKKSE